MTFVKACAAAGPVYRLMRAFLFFGLLVPAAMSLAQQTPVVPPPAPAKPGSTSGAASGANPGANPGSAVPQGASAKPSNAEFTAAADEVLQQMSQITGLAQRTPVKKTLRSREEIRAYVIREMNEDKEPAERYNSARSAEALGLLPKGFDLDNFMVDLLTEQIAGLYDPKT
jgi:hypothetical protein